MRCITDLTHVSTNSLPSTLLKKTGGRNQVPFYDRVIPPSITALALDEQRNDHEDNDLSSVSTQSTPFSQNISHQENSLGLIREVSLYGKDLPKERVSPHSRRSIGQQRPRRPSPERCIQSTKCEPKATTATTTMPMASSKQSESLRYDKKSLSDRDDDIKSAANISNHQRLRKMHQTSTEIHKVRGRTLPINRSTDVLCSNDEDDDHRYIVTVTTSRSTIKARGGRGPPMYASPQRAQGLKSFSFSNSTIDDDISGDYSTDLAGFDDILNEGKYNYDATSSQIDSYITPKRPSFSDNDIASATASKRSGKLSTIESEQSRDNSTIAPKEVNIESNLTSTAMSIKSNRQLSTVSQTSRSSRKGGSSEVSSERNRRFTSSPNILTGYMLQRVDNDAVASQSKSLSSTRFLSRDDDANDVERNLRSRDDEILSAAASRKTGKTGKYSSSRSREVLIEEHEKPRIDTNSTNGTTTWRKIDDVLFGDDQSELHLFKTPAKDVAFDDLLTTTSDCSSISVSLDPSGCIVNENRATTTINPHHVISDIQFDKVKSALDRMRKPMMIHTTMAIPNRAMMTYNAPKAKNRIGAGKFIQNRFKDTVPISNIPTAHTNQTVRKPSLYDKVAHGVVANVEDVPVVRAQSFHGDTVDQEIIESLPVPDQGVFQKPPKHGRNEQQAHIPVLRSQGTGSSGRKDPPAW
jgi:hypothetical protein